MKSDIVIEGKNAEIFKKLIAKDFYQSNTDIFFDSLMLGLLYGKKGDITIGDERVEITRTWLNNPIRSNFRTLISTFINLELHHQGEPLKMQEIFLDELGTNSSEKAKLMRDFASFGIKKLDEIYFHNTDIDDLTDYFNFVSDDIKAKSQLDFQEYYEGTSIDEELKEIINEMG